MASISRSDPVVDDFLSSLSQLSQARIREDQQRQRDLQRNIDGLKLRLNGGSPAKGVGRPDMASNSSSFTDSGITLLKFNRDLSYVDANKTRNVEDTTFANESEEKGPDLPKRRYLTEEGPKYPPRSSLDDDKPPILPARKDILVRKVPPLKPPKTSKPVELNSFDVELLKPISRKSDRPSIDKKVIPQKNGIGPKELSGVENSSSKHPRSFIDIENDIKISSISNTFDSRVEDLIKSSNLNREPKLAHGNKHGFDNQSSSPEANSKPSKIEVKSSDLLSHSFQHAKIKNANSSDEHSFGGIAVKPKPKIDSLNSQNSSLKIMGLQSASIHATPNSKLNSSSIPQSAYKPTPKPKSDWLTSALFNDKTTSTQQDATKTLILPKNVGSSIHFPSNNNNSAEVVAHSQVKEKPTDWISSVYKNPSSTRTKQPPATPKPSYLSSKNLSSITNQTSLRETQDDSATAKPKKPTSWIDSALKKSDSPNKYENLKPSFQITKNSTASTIEERNEEPELLFKFKDKSLLPSKPPIIPPKILKKDDLEEEPLEYLTKLKEIKTSKVIEKPIVPLKPSKDQFMDKDEVVLAQTKMKLAQRPVVPKATKPSLDKYQADDELVLKSTMRALSPNKMKLNSRQSFQEKDTEELRNQMKKLSTSPSKFSQPNLKRYEEQDTEELKHQLNKLGTKKSSQSTTNNSQNKAEGLIALEQLKPIKPAKPAKPTSKPTNGSESITKSTNDLIEKSIELNTDEVDFKSQLSSILRVGSGPLTPRNTDNDIKNITYSQGSSDKKLTHHNKSRAKGPKRRLPTQSNKNNTATSTNIPSVSQSSTSSLTTPSRKPYLNKQNKPKPEIKVKPRVFSGEVFI